MIYALSSCSTCGVYPWDAPFGEFCPMSDECDLDLHQFAVESREEVTASPSPAVASSGGSPGPVADRGRLLPRDSRERPTPVAPNEPPTFSRPDGGQPA